MARTSVGTVTASRLLLGRCLLALQEGKLYRGLGCSGPVHYAEEFLGEPKRSSRDALRVADRLRWLPRLTRAADDRSSALVKWKGELVQAAGDREQGHPRDRTLLVGVGRQYNCTQLEKLVALTPKGAIPGEVEPGSEKTKTELRCPLEPGVFRLLEQARVALANEKGESVTTAQVLEWVLTDYVAAKPVSDEVVERARRETDKDLAERARQQPLVWKARELALEMGLLGPSDPEIEEEEPLEECLARAVGRPTWVVSSGNPGVQSWENERLRFNPIARSTTKAQRRELLRRDGYCCQTPGCPNRLWLHLHHIQAYAENGKTVRENLVCLCSSCHRNVHNGTLIVTRDSDGLLLFTDRNGRPIHRVVDLEVAAWLDCWVGWSGHKWNSHSDRAFSGTWSATRNLARDSRGVP